MLVNYFGPRPSALTADAFTNGQSGMQSGQAQVDQASREIAKAPGYQQQQPAGDVNGKATEATGVRVSSMTRELINLHEGELVFKANARSIEAAQSMFDSLLSIGGERSAAERDSAGSRN